MSGLYSDPSISWSKFFDLFIQRNYLISCRYLRMYNEIDKIFQSLLNIQPLGFSGKGYDLDIFYINILFFKVSKSGSNVIIKWFPNVSFNQNSTQQWSMHGNYRTHTPTKTWKINLLVLNHVFDSLVILALEIMPLKTILRVIYFIPGKK